VVSEVFLSGNEPDQQDDLYRRLQINRETGRLATVFTRPALIEERVFLIPAPEAVEWAQKAGLPTPPETYDVPQGPLSTSPEVAITSPGMFDWVGGTVDIRGGASGEEFQSYRLQVGEGLNPREWVQIDQESSKPVEDGLLGQWDTRGKSGLYSLQLLVLRAGQRVDTAAVQFMVDNQPPQVSLSYPTEGQTFRMEQQNHVTFQASAGDDLGLETVDFLVDGHSLAKISRPPYAVPWQAQPGRHTLQVIARDYAGNTNRAEVEFTVK
jgi:hypothetical protein